MTVDKAQELGLAYCKEHFPGHQAIVCTHPDGHNHSGNIHVHIVINSLRIAEVERKPYMDRPSDTRAGAKHRCTAAATGTAPPRQTKFETDKDSLQKAIRAALSKAKSFEEFSSVLMQEYPDSISARLQRHKAAINAPKSDTIQNMVDIQKKRSEGKGTGYEKWAKIHNLKQAAKTVNFLSEHGFTSPVELEAALQEAAAAFDTAGSSLKELERRIAVNRELIRQITVYRQTKPAYDGLKIAKKPEQYREQHRPDLARHEAAVRYFREHGIKKLPAVPKLQAENEALISEKNAIYGTYREQKTKITELQKVKSNIVV